MTDKEQEVATEEVQAPTPEELRARSAECFAEIKLVLAKFDCRIVPFLLEPEPVGQDITKMLVTASYGIVPNQVVQEGQG